MRKATWFLGLALAVVVSGVEAQPRPGRTPLRPGKAPTAAQVAKNESVVLNARRLWTSSAWLDPMKMMVSSSRNRMTSLRGHSTGSGAILGLHIYKGFQYDFECAWDWPGDDGSMRFNVRFIRGGDITLPVQASLRSFRFSLRAQTSSTNDARLEIRATATEPWVLKSCSVRRTRK